MMKYLILLILSMIALQGCSVYGGLTKCEGFDEAGTRCTGLISNLEYSKQREQGINLELEAAEQSVLDGIMDYKQLDAQVRNDEFARLTLEKKVGMFETDPVLRPAKTVKATIYPYSDGSKFYQLRHIWIKTHEEEWIVGSTMLVDAKGTVMMNKGATIEMVRGLDDTKTATAPTGAKPESSDTAEAGETASSIDSKTTELNDTKPRSELSAESAESIGTYKAGDIVTINVVFLNIREEPDGRIIGVIPAGGKLRILDETNGKWQRVQRVYYPTNQLRKEYDGWVHADYLMAINPEVDTWEDSL